MNELVKRWVRPEIQDLQAYHVPPAADVIKLDAMENPYTWPQEMIEAWQRRLATTPVNRYPDPAAGELVAKLRDYMGVPAAADIVLGNGSDETIQMMALALARPGAVMLAPEPGFVMYKMLALFAGMEYVGVPLRADFSLDKAAMLAAIEAHQPALVFLAYPNNPTGNLFTRADIEAIIAAAPGLVVLDEAYAPFAGDTFMADLARFDNLAVMRTVSKLGLAGLRLGFVAVAPAWARELDKVRLPYNINVLTQVSACFALEHVEVFAEQTQHIVAERTQMMAALKSLKDVEPYPSSANFILFRCLPGQAGEVFQALLAEGVLIKNLDAAGGLLKDCLRVTVGTPEENRIFLSALEEILSRQALAAGGN